MCRERAVRAIPFGDFHLLPGHTASRNVLERRPSRTSHSRRLSHTAGRSI
jgi:hypothetical protein